MKSVLVRALAAGALVAGSMSAQAAVTLNLTGFANGSQNIQGAAPGFNVNAGAFVGTLSNAPGFNANPFYTYCVQLTQNFGFGALPNYSVVNGLSYFPNFTPQVSPATVVDRLGKLFTFLGGVNLPANATISAAIQTAVWESIYETGAALNALSGNGSFSLNTGTTNTNVATLANTYLTGAAGVATSLYSISVLKNDNLQDFLLVQRVPVPASLALVALGLGLMWSVRRRA